MPNPTPIPNRILPKMSINLNSAAPLKAAPAMKKTDANIIAGFRPNLVQNFDAKKLAIKAERYREEVNN